MKLFNLGKKDEYGAQRRIEHRGRYLRASRTGGVALRAQTKAAGVNMTANTSRGFRVSGTPAKNTQLALQNGRFILRGRYGRGPTKLNVSKTGATVSTRNRLGSFNWIKANRSSAKVAGIQVRGKTAANLQIVYMAFAAVAALLQLVAWAAVTMAQVIAGLVGIMFRLAIATPYALHVLRRRVRNWRIRRSLPAIESAFETDLASWQEGELVAGFALALTGWGRGHDATAADRVHVHLNQNSDAFPTLRQSLSALQKTATKLEAARAHATRATDERYPHRAIMAILGATMADRLTTATVTEALLEADELALEDGPRTLLQAELIEVFTDFAGIRLQEAETVNDTEATQDRQRASPERKTTIDLNTATLGELQTLPHLGPERAKALIAMRPIKELSQLQSIDGIGPQRLEDIRRYGVTPSG